MKTLLSAFTEHPASVNENYTQHLATAWGFAFRLLGAGIASVVHGLFPFLFVTTGSSTIHELHARMITDRVRRKKEASAGTA